MYTITPLYSLLAIMAHACIRHVQRLTYNIQASCSVSVHMCMYERFPSIGSGYARLTNVCLHIQNTERIPVHTALRSLELHVWSPLHTGGVEARFTIE